MDREMKSPRGKKTPLFSGKVKDILIVCALALALLITAWSVFRGGGASKEAAEFTLSEKETKVMRLLREIEGVGEASVIVCEDEDEVKSVVVVCEGAKNLQVIMDVREAVSAALDAPQNAVKIYLKKD